jgi:hypothetical protein
VSAEFLTGVVYGCQVVVTNPSSRQARSTLQILRAPCRCWPRSRRRASRCRWNLSYGVRFSLLLPGARKFRTTQC